MRNPYDFVFPIDTLIVYSPITDTKVLTIMETSVIMGRDGVVSRSYRVKGGAVDTWVNAEDLEEKGEVVDEKRFQKEG